MAQQKAIIINYSEEQKINGLGMMIGQYLEQNLDEFEDKVKQALKLNISTSVEVEKGISTTIKFAPGTILIQNGVSDDTHLHLKSSYATLADVLSGKVNPFKGVMDGRIRVKKIPATKPFQTLKLLWFLKIPAELLVEKSKPKKIVLTWERMVIFLLGMGCGIGVMSLIMMFLRA